jgi:hypothetical protein
MNCADPKPLPCWSCGQVPEIDDRSVHCPRCYDGAEDSHARHYAVSDPYSTTDAILAWNELVEEEKPMSTGWKVRQLRYGDLRIYQARKEAEVEELLGKIRWHVAMGTSAYRVLEEWRMTIRHNERVKVMAAVPTPELRAVVDRRLQQEDA